MRWLYYKNILKNCLIFWCAVLALFMLERAAFLWWFVSEGVRKQYGGDLPTLFLKGGLFDIKIASILTILPFLLGLLSLTHTKALRLYSKVQPVLLAIVFALVCGFVAGNWFYFGVYGNQFDVFVFGLFDEDTKAVLRTVWSDYPVVSGGLAVAAAGYLFGKLITRIRFTKYTNIPLGKAGWLVLILLPILLLAAGSRGSLGKFPLRKSAAQVSAAPEINKLVPNALVSLDWAVKEYRNSSHFETVSDEEGIELISRLLSRPASADLKQFDSITPKNPAVEQHKPNVVFAVMESMGTHLLSFDKENRDLLGALKPHWKEDWVYLKFVSEGDGTSDSLHRFFVRSPRLDLSQSTAKNKNFPTNMFKPYLDAGYKVVYITAGNGGWRDFDQFLRHLGVTEFVDENTLKKRYPEAKSGTWGVPDEFMFRYAADELKQAQVTGKPVFIMMLSVTNHPPYLLPEGQPRMDFTLDEAERKRLAGLEKSGELNEILNTFRYSNDQLGRFVSAVKKEAPDTIIAATGDHNMRAVGYPEAAEAALGHAVPFYLYVPQVYRNEAVYHPERAGSHKDILPTLYEVSLSQAHYYQTGCNLTAKEPASPWCGYGYNTEVIITDEGFYHQGSKEFRLWNGQGALSADTQAVQPGAESMAQINKARSYTPFLNWQINRIVTTE